MITAEQAAEIAMQARGFRPSQISENRWAPSRVSDEAPAHWYWDGGDEPVWYVWFSQIYFSGLASSEVIAVSKRTGIVLRRELANDEG